MKKSFWILYLVMLGLGAIQGEAGWVYLEDDEIASREEIELSETVGRIEGDDEGVTLNEEALLPWDIDEPSREEFSTFIEEHAKQASREYEESFTLDASTEDYEGGEQLPSPEKVPSRTPGLITSQPKVVESPKKQVKVHQAPKVHKPAPSKKKISKGPLPKKSSKPVYAKKKAQAPAKPRKFAKKPLASSDQKLPSHVKKLPKKQRASSP